MSLHSFPFTDATSSSHTPPYVMPRRNNPVRLRLACDACTISKVRCSKTHPCERCVDNQEECRFSASRRHGRRALRKRGDSDTQQSPPSSDIMTPNSDTLTTKNEGQGFPFDSLISWEDTIFASNHASLQEWSQHDVEIAFRVDDACDLSTMTTRETPDIMVQLQSSHKVPCSSWNMVTEPSTLAERLSSSTPTTILSSDSQHSEKGHNCEARALSTLHSLQYNPESLPSNSFERGLKIHEDNSRGLAEPPRSTLSVETLLSANQSALNTLQDLFTCPCAQNLHMASLYSAILAKVFFWYRVAVTARYQTDGVELRPLKIQLGTLDLDEVDQKSLQRAVLLRELRKGEKVLEAFNALSRTEEGSPVGHKLWYDQKINEAQAIIQEIQNDQHLNNAEGSSRSEL
ncbi:hypothetical protein F4803DRAFT_520840 [Xylaria telfairii]|nr:hypothetical protein F4803DRAFT_520840 [Xylaria telfairii]